jgi:hypothetical protein
MVNNNSALGSAGLANAVASKQLAQPAWVGPSTYGADINPNPYGPAVRLDVHRAANGFILRSARVEGGLAVTQIAATIEELRDLITAELVAQKMDTK